jgi:hypothetical protein
MSNPYDIFSTWHGVERRENKEVVFSKIQSGSILIRLRNHSYIGGFRIKEVDEKGMNSRF